MRIPRWLIIPALIIICLYWTQDYWQGSQEPSVFDLPKKLEDREFTLTVYPVSNVNGVPVFTATKGDEDNYMYLVPATSSTDFPADFAEKKDSGYTLQVHGKFFMGKGIPAEYLQTKPKPERLRVFQFDHAELVASKENL